MNLTMMQQAQLGPAPLADIRLNRVGHLGRITLNRPSALNALTLDMVREIASALDAWERDPSISIILIDGEGERGLCAGGDIRAIYQSGRAQDGLAQQFWREEYQLNARIASYPKPVIAWMDGIVMGGGVGISAHASHRIVTERTKLAMPEVAIGFVPDVGASWLLAHAPQALARYLVLTGNPIGPADAIGLGFADFRVSSTNRQILIDRLALVSPHVDAARHISIYLEPLLAPVEPGLTPESRQIIDACFSEKTVKGIVARLERVKDPFAVETLATMMKKSPSSLMLAFETLNRAGELQSLEDCLKMEFRVAFRLLGSSDLYEGIHAVVIDKGSKPNWQPASLADVKSSDIDAYFEPLGQQDLRF